MRKSVKVPFEVTMSFPMPNGGLGVVIRQIQVLPASKHLSFVLLVDDVFGSKPVGSAFDVDCEEQQDGRLRYPANLEQAWFGPVGNAAKQIESRYLALMYLNALNSGYGTNGEGKVAAKSFDPKDVFATPVLVLFEALYKTIVDKDIKEVLADTNFRYVKRGYYTRFDGDDVNTSYNTPRTLNYHPESRTVVVSFMLEHRDNIPANTLPEPFADKYRGDAYMIQRFYTNTGWLTLRDLCKKDANVWGLISSFIDRGFIKPVDLNKVK